MVEMHTITYRGAWAMRMLQQAETFPLSPLERSALEESCRLAPTDDDVQDILLEMISENFKIDDQIKASFAESIIMQNWSEAASFLGVSEDDDKDDDFLNDGCHGLKRIFLSMLRASRKMAASSEDQRKIVEEFLTDSDCEDSLVYSTLWALVDAQTIDEETRTLIFDDIMEGRFYRILRPDRLDCNEILECTICLERIVGSPKVLSCGHVFCSGCIVSMKSSLGNTFPCPLCREWHRV